jgi:spore coat-associated protein N
MKKCKSGLLVAFILIVIGALLIGGATVALFTDTAENTGNRFQSGILEVQLDRDPGNYYFELNNIAPGDKGTQLVIISNTGSLDLVYQFSYKLTGELAQGYHPLQIEFLDSDGLPIDLSLERRLNSGQDELTTITWELPLEAGNEYQAGTATFDLLINAVQLSGQENGSVMDVFKAAMARSAINYDEFMSKGNHHNVGSPPYSEYNVNSWNGYLEKQLEAGNVESNQRITIASPQYGNNTIGYVNPFSENETRGSVINLLNLGVFNYFRNNNPYKTMIPAAIIITRHSYFEHGRADDTFIRNNLDVLAGSIVFYKADNSPNDQVQIYYINMDGTKSDLVPISEILLQ